MNQIPTVGTVENSGPNRKARRFRASWDAKLPNVMKLKRIKGNFEDNRVAHRKSKERQQAEAHSRAVLRKEAAKPGSQDKGEIKLAQAILKEQAKRKKAGVKGLSPDQVKLLINKKK